MHACMRCHSIMMQAIVTAGVLSTQPNTCQPRAVQPFMPLYHIIGNVTTDPATDEVTNIESINDVSSVIKYGGIYHVFHQCCQNHWDHVVSRDLIHWTRLPPPIVPNENPTSVPHMDWYDAHGSWDGSLSIPNEWNGLTEPVVVMTAVEGTKPTTAYVPRAFRTQNTSNVTLASATRGVVPAAGIGSGMAMGMAVVRASNASDPFLVNWTKDANNPIAFTSGAITSPYDTPGQVWRSGDHWNFLILGNRYTTRDPTFHTWGLAPGPKFIDAGENGGQWFSKLAPQRDGSPPPAGAPQWMMNVGGGNRYALGDYNPANETWTTRVTSSVIDAGPDANWMTGQFAGDRFMNIGWSTGGPPMANEAAIADAFPHEKYHSFAQMPAATVAAAVAEGTCALTDHWEVLPGYTNIYNREPSPTNITHGTLKFIGEFDSVEECFAAVNASSATDGPFNSFTYNDDTLAAPYGRHCWADTSMTWQGRGPGYNGQISGRGPGFPVPPVLPPSNRWTHDHLSGLREVSYDPQTSSLVSNPVAELAGLRNGTLASEKHAKLAPGASDIFVLAGTGYPADASAADVVINFTVPRSGAGAVGVRVLANISAGAVFGGVLTVVNFTTPDTNGTMHATASIRTLNPCGSGSSGLAQATFPILHGETTLDMRVLVDRSVVEAFIMGGRVVFSKTYNPAVLYVPDTHVAVHTWNTSIALDTSVDVFSMGCGWTQEPYQPHPTMESISTF